ncbi:hypothetical protein [Flavobacterium frigidimaris]|uniref:Beta/Gamma crystallin n=1 Tax=Flavobacterium frigidimaris TaxID=262320 RepID=A0ABX4BLE6_FLAFR|nr:hypothetical protein [Flavobacterium frigidimaris]OXA76819.1 hypothetical protein B0A65_17945 [Flavobacterium frigidimaris]
MKRYLILFLLTFQLVFSQEIAKLEPCEVWPAHPEKPTKMYVFIGKKIKIWESPSSYCNVGALTSRVLSKYLVVKNIYGDFKKDTIQFTTYPPAFSSTSTKL